MIMGLCRGGKMIRYVTPMLAAVALLAACEDSSYPFTTVTDSINIVYSLPQAGQAELLVVNCFQNAVKTLVDQPQEAGEHSAVWDLTDDQGEYSGDGLYTVELYLDGQRIWVSVLEVNGQ
jgi:flagellar hook assembly protein FlgD